jgi:hypothetical protein
MSASDEQDQLAKNHVLIDTLRAHGDSLIQPREVRHWIYFTDAAKRYEFVAATAALGYKADCVTDEKLGKRPHRALLTRIDRVDPAAVDNAVLELRRLASQHDGEYDGWECALIRDNEVSWWKKFF